MVKNPLGDFGSPNVGRPGVRSLGQEDPWRKSVATSSILAWENSMDRNYKFGKLFILLPAYVCSVKLCVCGWVGVVNIVACYDICKYMNSVFSLKWWFLFLKGTNLFTDRSPTILSASSAFVSLFRNTEKSGKDSLLYFHPIIKTNKPLFQNLLKFTLPGKVNIYNHDFRSVHETVMCLLTCFKGWITERH